MIDDERTLTAVRLHKCISNINNTIKTDKIRIGKVKDPMQKRSYNDNNRFNNNDNGSFNGSITNRGNSNNPLGNWIQNIRGNRRSRNTTNNGAVGTEANAMQNMKQNAKQFNYPKEGFITPIEHSLLWAMIQYPQYYPDAVVRKEIDDEEFEQYLYVNHHSTDNRRNSNVRGFSDEIRDKNQYPTNDSRSSSNGMNHSNTASATTNKQDEEIVSYMQLSALLALSASKNPPSDESCTTSISNNDNKEQNLSIGEVLCRKLLKTITRYADRHDLNRGHEISEFLSPVEKICIIHNEQASLKGILPAYAGYTLSLLTGNPIPLLIGAVALAKSENNVGEIQNMSDFKGMGGRTADLETSGLMDEWDDEDHDDD